MTEKLHNNANSSPKTEWDSLAEQSGQFNPDNGRGLLANQSNQISQDNRQRRKIIAYYLSGVGDTRLVTGQRDAVNVTENDESAVKTMIVNGEIPSRFQSKLLMSIAGPLSPNPHIQRGNQIYNVIKQIGTGSKEEDILKYVTNYNPANSHNVTLSSVDGFIKDYPTPIDFHRLANGFMSQFDTSTAKGMEDARDYEEAMDSFQRKIYGKKYEYYLQMMQLEEEAHKESRAMAERRYAEMYAKKASSSQNSASRNEPSKQPKSRGLWERISRKFNQ